MKNPDFRRDAFSHTGGPEGISFPEPFGRYCNKKSPASLFFHFGCLLQASFQRPPTMKNPDFRRDAFSHTGGPEGIRTPNQQNRNLSFYPVELRVLLLIANLIFS